MPKISFLAKEMKEYRGQDHVTGKNILLKEGDQAVVSDEKAEQLSKDYPKEFHVEQSDKPAKASEPAAPATEKATPTDKPVKGAKKK